MILYEYSNNIFKKQGKRISKKQVQEELKKYQLQRLLENGKISVKIKPLEFKGEQEKTDNVTNYINNTINSLNTKEKQRKTKDKNILTKSQIRKITKIRDLYHVDYVFYKNKGWRYELWCKNKKGFSNFIAYLTDNSEQTIQKAILQDLIGKDI